MTTEPRLDPDRDLYPDSDGQPIAESTLQFEWIAKIEQNLDALYGHDPNVFVAGDLFWYAVRGSPATRTAPDALVVFGRPKGDRGSYKQWEEGGIPPQVVFEVLPLRNCDEEMAWKFEFYDRYGVEEYYVYDPDNVVLSGWLRSGAGLQPVGPMHGWVSPRLGIRFDLSGDKLVILRPDGERFLTFIEAAEQWKEARRQAKEARRQAEEVRRQREEAERQAREAQWRREEARRQAQEARRQAEESQAEAAWHRTEEVQREAEEDYRRAERLAERLRALGIDPDA